MWVISKMQMGVLVDASIIHTFEKLYLEIKHEELALALLKLQHSVFMVC